ncbi:MAG: hypothetical protein FE048_04960, partial [Thermoplasmata archaeon]
MRKGIWNGVTCILVSVMLILSTVPLLVDSGGNNSIDISYKFCLNLDGSVLEEIEKTGDKILIVDKLIGDRHVKYWEHVVDGIYVKGDYILLHIDIESNDIVEYQRNWTDITLSFESGNDSFEPKNYFWKKMVVFLDEGDLNNFYSFYGKIEYPIICWEVRHTDGTTILYDLEGKEIGYGVPTPYEKGFSLNGYDKDVGPDCWKSWRLNADKWFKRWCNSTVSLASPTPSTISSYVRDEDVTYFFELAHGSSYNFRADKEGSTYSSSRLRSDMIN